MDCIQEILRILFLQIHTLYSYTCFTDFGDSARQKIRCQFFWYRQSLFHIFRLCFARLILYSLKGNMFIFLSQLLLILNCVICLLNIGYCPLNLTVYRPHRYQIQFFHLKGLYKYFGFSEQQRSGGFYSHGR